MSIIRRVIARHLEAKEFSTPGQMKNYLNNHPNADPKNHWVIPKDEKKITRGERRERDKSESKAKSQKERAHQEVEKSLASLLKDHPDTRDEEARELKSIEKSLERIKDGRGYAGEEAKVIRDIDRLRKQMQDYKS